MKIGIVSDSHGSTRAIDRMLSHPAAEGVTLWLHAGDITPDAEYLAMVTEGKAKVRYVAGNSDWPEPGARYDDVVEAAGHRIFLTHGHMYGVRFTTKMLCDAAGESGCDIAVYGHTHVAEISTGTSLCSIRAASRARAMRCRVPSSSWSSSRAKPQPAI